MRIRLLELTFASVEVWSRVWIPRGLTPSRRAVLVALFAGTAALASPAPRPTLPERLDLQQAIAFALENNFAIRQARERVRAQEGVVTTVTATARPTIAASADYQHSEVTTIQTQTGGTPLFVPVGPSWRMTMTVTQTVLAGGGVRASLRGADLAREAAVLDLQDVIDGALLDVRLRFYDVLLAREQIAVEAQNVELLRTQLHYATARAQAGTISDFERLRAEVAVANATVPLIQSQNELRLRVEDLFRALGFVGDRTDSVRKLPEFLGALAFEPASFDLMAAMTAARTNRPDLRRLEKFVAARETGVTVARSRYYPNLVISGGGELRKGPTDRFRDSSDGLRVGALSRVEVNPRATAGTIIQANSQLEQARLAHSEATLAAEVEVRRAYSAIEQSAELANALRQTVGQAEEAVRLATARFEAGAATQLDVLTAQVMLTKAKTTQIQANHGYNVAVARLRKATGTPDLEYRGSPALEQPSAARAGTAPK